MKINIKNFSSDLPCKVKDYEFSNLRKDEDSLLKSSELANRKIIGKGKYLDFYGAVDFDGFIIMRRKSGFHQIFRFKTKDGVRKFSEINGFILPAYPEMLILNNDTQCYSFDHKDPIPKDHEFIFDENNLGSYLESEDLGSGYKFYHGCITSITKQHDKIELPKLPDNFLSDLKSAWNEHKDAGIKVTILSGKCSKYTWALYDLSDFSIIESRVYKDGDPQPYVSIDLHNHLIPGVDDGSTDSITSMELADELKDLGITQITLTPHDNEDFNNPDLESKNYKTLKKDLDSHGIKSSLSNEHKVTEDFIKECHIDHDLRLHPYGFILLEYGKDQSRDSILKDAARMSLVYPKVLIAHPERYKNLTPYDISQLSGTGALMQCNYKSIDSEQDNDVIDKMKDLASKDLIDLLSTDTHKQEHIDQTEDHVDEFSECRIFNKSFEL